MDRPKRRVELVLQVSADSIKEMLYALDDFANQHRAGEIDLERNTGGVSAGLGSSYSFDVEYRPDRTPEQYAQMRDEYLKAKKQEAGEDLE